jgi:formyltetrahydrofolate-dependent phosphoribosylglycinamide formyltransferase
MWLISPLSSTPVSMLKGLQKKWQVSGVQLVLILCVFAITGSATAYISASIRRWLGFDENTWWVWKTVLSLTVLIFGYQIILMIVAFLFGQFAFFWKYEQKILARMHIIKPPSTGMSPNPSGAHDSTTDKHLKNIVVFASGAGSNAAQIIRYFKDSTIARVVLVVCNRAGAGVLQIAAKENLPVLMIEKKRFAEGDAYLPELQNAGADLLVLAGFLWKIPDVLVHAYPRRIINIHPALLPKFGGKGMYGAYVHQSVISAGEMESGITIHYVDEHYDNGDVIFQTACPILENDSPEALAARIHQLEHLHYPAVVEDVIRRLQAG